MKKVLILTLITFMLSACGIKVDDIEIGENGIKVGDDIKVNKNQLKAGDIEVISN